MHNRERACFGVCVCVCGLIHVTLGWAEREYVTHPMPSHVLFA
jgi:hypothetical protein